MSNKDNSEEQIQTASRLRQIRENAGLKQEQFAEILGISVLTYKDIESGEKDISIENLITLYKKMNISTDYMLFGEKQNCEYIWKKVISCTETDKLFIMLRLLVYFIEDKKITFPLREDKVEQEIMHLINGQQRKSKTNED